MPTSSLYHAAPGGIGVGHHGNGHLPANASSLSLNSLDMDGGHVHHAPHHRGSSAMMDVGGDGRAMQLALELALLQGSSPFDGSSPTPPVAHHHNHHHQLTSSISGPGMSYHHHHSDNPLLHPFGLSGHSMAACGGMGGSLEDLKQRRSQNMTECVPVPTSEHVAEIVGRQGCKIKALRAKTNTYIKTPVRGEEPVFVVTGRKEDVALAKREILSAADHFSQIRASRSKNTGINSTLAFGQLVANQPGQTTTQVRVPYRVVGLVVGPKGATIKRIQQQTHTYIVTPSRDKEPVFDVTGLPENVEAARKEIEAHIALRTGADGGPSCGNIYGIGEHLMDSDAAFGVNGFSSSFSSSNGHLDHLGTSSSSSGRQQQSKFSILNGGSGNGGHMDSAFSSLSSSSSTKGITLQSLLDSNNFGGVDLHSHSPLGMGGGRQNGQQQPGGSRAMAAWSNGGTDSHDSGIGNSPPFESNGHHTSLESSLATSILNGGSTSSGNNAGIWGELNKVLGSLDLNGPATNPSLMSMLQHDTNPKSFLNVGSRSSLDLGTLGRPSAGLGGVGDFGLRSNGSSHHGSSSSASSHHTATPPHTLLLSSGDASPPNSLPFGRGGHHLQQGLQHHRASVSSEPSGLYCDLAESADLAVSSSSLLQAECCDAASDKVISSEN